MSRKLVLGVAAAGLAIGMIAPAMAQGDRGASERDRGYSGESGRSDESDRSPDRGRYDNDRYDNDRYDNNRRPDRRVRTLSFPTRHRATILLTETVSRDGRRSNNVCYVEVRGPESRYVSRREVSRVARNHCSRNARIVLR